MNEFILTHMTKTQVYLREDELAALHALAGETGQSVAELIRQAIRRVWLKPDGQGVVDLWDGPTAAASLDHDTIYDEP